MGVIARMWLVLFASRALFITFMAFITGQRRHVTIVRKTRAARVPIGRTRERDVYNREWYTAGVNYEQEKERRNETRGITPPDNIYICGVSFT